MNLTLLNNPVWNSLNSHHRALGIWGNHVARYQPDIFPVAGMPEYNEAGFEELKNLVKIDEFVGIMTAPSVNFPGWEVLQSSMPILQMVCEHPNPASPVDIVTLNLKDAPEMLALVDITHPGPFMPRTVEIGGYIGVRQDGQLIAMAGERMHPGSFCEISAVCTHPDFRGRGLAGALVTQVAQNIIARNETPFLHVAPTNENAIGLYKKLGFHLHQEIKIDVLRRTA